MARASALPGLAVAGNKVGNWSSMQYFIRTMEKSEGRGAFSPEVACAGLHAAKAEAKRVVMASDPAVRLLADACSRNGGQVRTLYRCWINDRGDFQESILL